MSNVNETAAQRAERTGAMMDEWHAQPEDTYQGVTGTEDGAWAEKPRHVEHKTSKYSYMDTRTGIVYTLDRREDGTWDVLSTPELGASTDFRYNVLTFEDAIEYARECGHRDARDMT